MMNKTHFFDRRWIPITFSLCLAMSQPAWAGPGHDHGEKPENNTSAAPTPRFTIEDKHLEAVGIVKQHTLHLYLDHHDTNEPLAPTSLELSINNTPIQLEQKAEGHFEGELPEALQRGELQVQLSIDTDEYTETINTALVMKAHEEQEHAHAEKQSNSHTPWWLGFIAFLLASSSILIYKKITNSRRKAS